MMCIFENFQVQEIALATKEVQKTYNLQEIEGFEVSGDIGMTEPLSPHDEWVQDDLTNVKLAIDQFRVSNAGHYPGTLADLAARDATGNSFLFELPTDPWGNTYEYMPPDPDATGGELWLYSLGADGEPGGVNDDADIFFRG